MNEEKVMEAIRLLRRNAKSIVGYEAHQDAAILLLTKAIAPEQPEIPEGCPVIITYDDGHKISGHMDDPSCGGAASIEIDYPRIEQQFKMLKTFIVCTND